MIIVLASPRENYNGLKRYRFCLCGRPIFKKVVGVLLSNRHARRVAFTLLLGEDVERVPEVPGSRLVVPCLSGGLRKEAKEVCHTGMVHPNSLAAVVEGEVQAGDSR